MRLSLTGMSAVAMLCVAGCATRGNVDLLESRIRLQEDQIFAAQRELKNAQSELVVARREIDALRTRMESQSIAAPASEQLHEFARAEAIVISKLLSGGLDRDGQPGHDVFNTVVTPVDSRGDLAKASGSIRLEMFDLSRDGGERTLGVWDFSAEDAETHWKKSLFGAGYTFQLPWKEPPLSNRVMLHARLTTSDGRQFDTTQELSIQPPGVIARGKPGAARLSRADAGRPASPPLLNGPAGAPLRKAATEMDLENPVQEATEPSMIERSGFLRISEGMPPESRSSARHERESGDAKPAGIRPAASFEAPPPRRRKELVEPEPQFEEDRLPPPAEELDAPFDEPLPRPRADVPRFENDNPFDERGAVEVRKPARADRVRPIPTSDRWTEDSRPVLR